MGESPSSRDRQFVQEFEQTLTEAFDSVSVNVFLCGKGLPEGRKHARMKHDLRWYLKEQLEREVQSCRVKLGEHREFMRLYGKVAGTAANNLADHEFALAKRTDLIVIFPCSPGSFAELGMFCLEDSLAAKMAIFLDAKFRASKSYVVEGPIAAAKRRRSMVFVVKYSHRTKIWEKIRDLVLDVRANKGKGKLLTP